MAPTNYALAADRQAWAPGGFELVVALARRPLSRAGSLDADAWSALLVLPLVRSAGSLQHTQVRFRVRALGRAPNSI